MQRVQRPEQGAGKRCQLVLEDFAAESVHDINGECVQGKLEQVVRAGIETGYPADEPIIENMKRPVKTGLRTWSEERPYRPQKNPPPQVGILDKGVLQDLFNVVINKPASQDSLVKDHRHQNQQPTAQDMILLKQIIQTGQQCSTPLLTLRTDKAPAVIPRPLWGGRTPLVRGSR